MSTVLPPGFCRLQWMFLYCPIGKTSPPFGLWRRDVWPALHSEVGVALVCDGPIFLQQDLHPALSGREIVDLPPIAVGERRDILRDLEPASSTIAAIMDCQVVAVLHVGAVPFDLMHASHQPDFSAVGLDDGQRWHCGRRCWCGRGRWIWPPTIPPAGVDPIRDARAKSTPDDHFTAGPDRRVRLSASGRVGGAGSCPIIRAGIVSPASIQPASHPPQTIISLPVQIAV